MVNKSISYRSGYKYQLAESHVVKTSIKPDQDIATDFIKLTTDGLLTLAKGYAWDGVTNAPDFDTAMRASAVHDALYQLIRLRPAKAGLPKSARKKADEELRRILIKDGMPRPFAKAAYEAVRLFGEPSASPESRKKIHTAP